MSGQPVATTESEHLIRLALFFNEGKWENPSSVTRLHTLMGKGVGQLMAEAVQAEAEIANWEEGIRQLTELVEKGKRLQGIRHSLMDNCDVYLGSGAVIASANVLEFAQAKQREQDERIASAIAHRSEAPNPAATPAPGNDGAQNPDPDAFIV